MAPSAADDDDPVKAEYDIFITPQLAEDLYLLQYPNRNRRYPYNDGSHAKPTELRVKPTAGFLELDVPVKVNTNDFDRAKGIRWGEQLRRSKQSGLESYGLSSGFTQYNSASNGRRLGRPEQEDDESDDDVQAMIDNFNESNDRGLVLNRQTLGGQLLRDEASKPLYMVGAFRGKELHLTRVTGIVQMRPQFHHLDAEHQLESAKRRKEREAAEPPRANEPRAVQMTIKAADGENIDAASTRDFLRTAQEEQWARLPFHDEDDDRAYEVYHQKLFESETSAAPRLNSRITAEEYLDGISVLHHEPGRPKKKPSGKKQVQIDDSSLAK